MTDDHADVVVIGSGIVGAFVAQRLARAGASVVVVDPAPGDGASSGNAGMLVPSYCVPMANPAVLADGVRAILGGGSAVALRRPLSPAAPGWLARFVVASRPGRARRDARRLAALAAGAADAYAELADSEGVDIGLRRSGWLYVCRRPRVLAAQVRAASRLADLGIRHEVLDPSGLREREPGLSHDLVGGVLYPDDASLDPAVATRAVLDSALRHGARLHRQQVVGVETDGWGSVRAVRTPEGRFTGRTFVLATGAHSRKVGRLFGLRLPVEPGFGCSTTLPASPGLGAPTAHALMGADEHIVISPGGSTVRVTGGMQFGGRQTSAADPAAIADLRSAAERLLPSLRALPAGTAWRGARPMTPSGLPIIGPLGRNVVAATGHGTLGMTLAPATGRLVESLLTHGTSPFPSRPTYGDPS
ncbi:MAG: FAD-dependent oxidoreductase [Streptosporangiaceae bacterium]|nr:FAD-dependent oxidoreductase [Streptosporangiaceae bacterium]